MGLQPLLLGIAVGAGVLHDGRGIEKASMTEDQEMKRDLLKDYFVAKAKGPWLDALRDAMLKVGHRAGGISEKTFAEAVDILYAKVEKGEPV